MSIRLEVLMGRVEVSRLICATKQQTVHASRRINQGKGRVNAYMKYEIEETDASVTASGNSWFSARHVSREVNKQNIAYPRESSILQSAVGTVHVGIAFSRPDRDQMNAPCALTCSNRCMPYPHRAHRGIFGV